MKTCLRLLALVVVCALLLPAADVNGKWTGEVQGGDQVFTVTFTLKADGEKLIGKMAGAGDREYDIDEGKVKGDDISFSVTIDFNGNTMKLLYTGKVAGDEIKFHLVPEGAPDYAQDFTAKRATT